MGYEGSWSGMRRYLEQDMLAEPLRGRVRYNCPSGVNLYEFQRFEICVDGRSIKSFSYDGVRSHLQRRGMLPKPPSNGSMNEEMWDYWRQCAEIEGDVSMEDRTEYTDGEFADALEQYRLQDIQTSLASDNPIVRMFAVLDRRVGKRTLEKLKDEIDRQPEWLQYFYRLRLGEA